MRPEAPVRESDNAVADDVRAVPHRVGVDVHSRQKLVDLGDQLSE